jgi:lipoprotein-releasing system permease protein
MAFEYFIGGRYLRTKQKQTFIFLITLLSIAGVTLGVMALIVVIAVMTGFESDIKSRILGVEAHVVLTEKGAFPNYRQVLEQIKKIGDIQAATPFINGQVMLKAASRTSGAVLRGIDPVSVSGIFPQIPSSLLVETDSPRPGNRLPSVPKIILGKELAENLEVVKGDRVYVIYPMGTLSPIGLLPAIKPFILAGTFSTGVYEYDGSLVFIDISDAQKMFRMRNAVTGIDIHVKDIYRAGECAHKIVRMLGPRYQATDWMERNHNLFSALKLERTVMFIILALIILVAAFSISSTLIMMVMDKTKDIAILKAMGATDKSIKTIFVFKGTATGLVGVLLGTAMGCLLCGLLKQYKFIELPDDVFYIPTLPVQLGVYQVLLIGLSAIIICLLATLYPAHKASKLNPIEAIRYG